MNHEDSLGLTTIPDDFNPTVGGGVWLRGSDRQINSHIGLLFWQNSKYVLADGIFTEVLKRRGHVFRVRKLHSKTVFYLVSNGSTHAHGNILKQAKADFKFKLIDAKLKDEPITEETVITAHHYRVLTGACEFGINDWMNTHLSDSDKSGIKAKQLLPLLQQTHAYGLDSFINRLQQN